MQVFISSGIRKFREGVPEFDSPSETLIEKLNEIH